MLSVPMAHTTRRRSFVRERRSSPRQVTAPRLLMITSASVTRSIFCSSVGRSAYTITSPNGSRRSRWGEPWIWIGSSPGTTMVGRLSKLIPLSVCVSSSPGSFRFAPSRGGGSHRGNPTSVLRVVPLPWSEVDWAGIPGNGEGRGGLLCIRGGIVGGGSLRESFPPGRARRHATERDVQAL